MFKLLEKLFSWLLLFMIVALLAEMAMFSYYFYLGKEQAKISKPFSFKPSNPNFTVLIVGDSNGVGTGAGDSNGSIAGKIHRDFPDAEILNLAEDGKKIHEVLTDLNSVEGVFDLLIIHAGANDILFMSDLTITISLAEHLLRRAKELSNTVIFTTSGDIGLTPVLPKLVGWFYSYRTREFLDNFKNISEKEGVFFVDMYRQTNGKEGSFFEEDKSLFSSDGLHLNEFGYEVWYKQIKNFIPFPLGITN